MGDDCDETLRLRPSGRLPGVSAKRTDDTAIRFLPLIVILVPSGPRGGEIARISGAVDWAAAESFAIRINARQLWRVRLAHRVSACVCTLSPDDGLDNTIWTVLCSVMDVTEAWS